MPPAAEIACNRHDTPTTECCRLKYNGRSTMSVVAMLKGFRCCSLNAVLLISVCGQLFTKCFVSCGSLSYKTSDGPTEIPLSGAPFTKFYCRTLPPGSLYASPNPFTGFSGRGFITTQVRMSAQALHYQGNSSSPTSGDCISSWNRLAGLSRCGFSLSRYAPSKSWFAWRTHEECVLKDSSPNSNLLHLGLANGFRHLVYMSRLPRRTFAASSD